MNLEDIARRAGVSRSTVSRVINNEPYVNSKTRERVLAIVEAEGFTPNPAARMLVTQRAQVIGVAIPRTLTSVFEATDYFPALLQGVSDGAQERDYATLLWLGHSDQDRDRFYGRILRNRLMDGLIIASATSDLLLNPRLLNTGAIVVTVERPLAYADRVSYVTVDNIKAAEDAVNHLLNLGRRRIGHITGAMDNPDAQDRLAGFQGALQQVGLFNPDLVAEGMFTTQSGYLGMMQILKRGPVDAVFAASDSMAFGALQALREAHLRVPQDVALVGFDDLPHASEATPRLTTIRQPIQQKGYLATRLLLDLIEGKLEGPQQIILPTQLVIRESTGFDVL